MKIEFVAAVDFGDIQFVFLSPFCYNPLNNKYIKLIYSPLVLQSQRETVTTSEFW